MNKKTSRLMQCKTSLLYLIFLAAVFGISAPATAESSSHSVPEAFREKRMAFPSTPSDSACA
jgi:hypothetical protein